MMKINVYTKSLFTTFIRADDNVETWILACKTSVSGTLREARDYIFQNN